MKQIVCFFIGGVILIMTAASSRWENLKVIVKDQPVPHAAVPGQEFPVISLKESPNETFSADRTETDRDASLRNPSGTTLESRFLVPYGYRRLEKPAFSFQGYLRQYGLKPDNSPVLLYDGKECARQDVHAAVFSMPLVEGDLQQCADSVIRLYGEYLWSVGAYDDIAFYLTNGFLMDYPSWRDGKRLLVEKNNVSWIKKAAYDDSKENFLKYIRQVMVYAGTISLENECISTDIREVLAGDLFIYGGSPGHCVMVVDVAEDEFGNRCFLLAQGFMPAQEFHVIKNPLHEDDPWYYVSEIQDQVITPEYAFSTDSFKRWREFCQ